MFNDSYGLTKAVLEGRKTMTRRLPNKVWKDIMPGLAGENLSHANTPFKYGEVVAVAQSYKDVMEARGESGVSHLVVKAGYKNKMFVKADLMPHQIHITKVRVEHLQDISDEDCIREGILEDSPGVQYSFPTEIGYCGQYPFDSARSAFAALIDKVSGKGTWESNPWVFVYEFELVK